MDSIRFDGFQGSGVKGPVAAFADGMMPLKKALLGSSWLLSWLLSSIHRFIGSGGWAGWLAGLGWAGWLFYKILWISGVEVRGLCHPNDAPKESFTRFQLAAIIDFY